MEELKFVNSINKEVHYLSYTVDNPKGSVVISHGMAEHPARYENLAHYLNNNNINVYAIYQIGHGKVASKLGHMDKGDFNQCVSNLYELIELVKGDKPVVLLGHSMGSFISQLYITRYNNIDGLLLSGSNISEGIMKIAKGLASIICAFSKDTSVPSKFMDNLSFGSYSKPFKNDNSKFAWLNQDASEVKKYEDDPYCGYVCSRSFFKELVSGVVEMGNKKALANVNKDLPILILGGDKDPVSSNGKGLIKLHEQYIKLGLKDVTLKLYQDDRHEIYLELNKDEVYKDTLNFLNKLFG